MQLLLPNIWAIAISKINALNISGANSATQVKTNRGPERLYSTIDSLAFGSPSIDASSVESPPPSHVGPSAPRPSWPKTLFWKWANQMCTQSFIGRLHYCLAQQVHKKQLRLSTSCCQCESRNELNSTILPCKCIWWKFYVRIRF